MRIGAYGLGTTRAAVLSKHIALPPKGGKARARCNRHGYLIPAQTNQRAARGSAVRLP